MSNPKQCYVHAWYDGAYRPVGILREQFGEWAFWYGRSFQRDGFDLDPLRLPRRPLDGVFRADGLWGALGVFSDALPDQWGRSLLKRLNGRPLDDIELLLADQSPDRLGALRFSEHRELPDNQPIHDRQWLEIFESWVGGDRRIPPADLMAGSSAGGARPKALVNIDGQALLAKFTTEGAYAGITDTTPWVEHGTMRLAATCGIRVPETRIIQMPSGRPVFLVVRFDRENGQPLHYLSANTLCGVIEHPARGVIVDHRSYLVFADKLSAISHLPVADRTELFRRAAFNLLINNHDDHSRNHGVIRGLDGQWRLSPAFDMVAGAGDRRDMAMQIGPEGTRASLENLLAGAQGFGLNTVEAREILKLMLDALKQWRMVFAEAGVPDTVVDSIAWAIQENAHVP